MHVSCSLLVSHCLQLTHLLLCAVVACSVFVDSDLASIATLDALIHEVWTDVVILFAEFDVDSASMEKYIEKGFKPFNSSMLDMPRVVANNLANLLPKVYVDTPHNIDIASVAPSVLQGWIGSVYRMGRLTNMLSRASAYYWNVRRDVATPDDCHLELFRLSTVLAQYSRRLFPVMWSICAVVDWVWHHNSLPSYCVVRSLFDLVGYSIAKPCDVTAVTEYTFPTAAVCGDHAYVYRVCNCGKQYPACLCKDYCAAAAVPEDEYSGAMAFLTVAMMQGL